MSNIYKNKQTNKWYREIDFLGTIYEEEITDEEDIQQLEEADKLLQDAIDSGVFDEEYV